MMLSFLMVLIYVSTLVLLNIIGWFVTKNTALPISELNILIYFPIINTVFAVAFIGTVLVLLISDPFIPEYNRFFWRKN